MPKPSWDNQDTEALLRAILALKTVDESRRFFRDLLTETELIEFAQRWKAARLLAKGARYTEIEQVTGLSSATIARVQKWLKGNLGGYQLILRRTKETL